MRKRTEPHLNLVVLQIRQKFEELKDIMDKTWTKMDELEKDMKKLKVNKIPLLSYGATKSEDEDCPSDKEVEGPSDWFTNGKTKNQKMPNALALRAFFKRTSMIHNESSKNVVALRAEGSKPKPDENRQLINQINAITSPMKMWKKRIRAK